MPAITPYLWFDGNAEEAMRFYTSVFKNASIKTVRRNGDVISGTFQIDGQEFMVLNGGPQYKFTPALSLYVNCETQQEVDELWEKLSAGGSVQRCGWLTDKYGVSWQIIPAVLAEMLEDEDAERAGRVMEALLQMDKIDIETLRQAQAGADNG